MSTTSNYETPELEKSGLVAVQPKAAVHALGLKRPSDTVSAL